MRILIAGPSGSGKTTFAARLGRILDIPHTEMDSLPGVRTGPHALASRRTFRRSSSGPRGLRSGSIRRCVAVCWSARTW